MGLRYFTLLWRNLIMWPFTRKDDEWDLLDIIFGPKVQINEYTQVQSMMHYWFNPKTREFKVNCSGGASMHIIGIVPKEMKYHTDILDFINDEMYENIWWPMIEVKKQ